MDIKMNCLSPKILEETNRINEIKIKILEERKYVEKDNAESSGVEFKPNAEIDLDDALHPGNMDWSFDKPSAPHTTVYIFNTD
jgi:hypothetical protein